MARIKKSLVQRESDLKSIIADAKQKLNKIQNKQKTDIGALACEHGLNAFDLKTLSIAFKKLHTELQSAR